MRLRQSASWIALFVMTIASPAAAQTSARASDRASTDGIEILTGAMQFDLSGTGWDMPVAIRASTALTDHVSLELGTTLATPEQQFGGSSFTAPEAQVSYAWRLGRVLPFVSGGAGAALIRSDLIGSRWRPTFSGGGGARIALSERVYAIGEMRLRAISTQFSATTAEWIGGIGWRLR